LERGIVQIEEIELTRLAAHPQNANVMGAKAFGKLRSHIAATDQYPPLIVRPMPEQAADERGASDQEAAAYQILDGHHRAVALRELGRQTARCVVWHVDDERALTLLATLNRLEGQDDPRKRAALLRRLHEHASVEALRDALPETAARLRRQLQAAAPVTKPPAPSETAAMPEAVHFFLTPSQRRAVEARLRRIGGGREAALLHALGVAKD